MEHKNNEQKQQDFIQFKIHELAEQTFILWAQLGLLLVSIGFATVGIVSYIKSQHIDHIALTLTRIFGDIFLFVGFALAFIALLQYRMKHKHREKLYIPFMDLSLFVGTMITALGLFAFIIILIVHLS